MQIKSLITICFLLLSTRVVSQHVAADIRQDAESQNQSVYDASVVKLQPLSFTDVNLFTGRPNISIPVFRYTLDNIPVNLVAAYNSSGVHVQETSGPLGTNWDLSTGFKITRVVNGNPDEVANGGGLLLSPQSTAPRSDPKGYWYSNNPWTTYNSTQKKQYYLDNYDSEIDYFTLVLNNKPIRFIFGHDRVPVTLTPSNIKIEYTLGSLINYTHAIGCVGAIVSFKITDEDGNKYYFGLHNLPESMNYAFIGTETGRSAMHEICQGSTEWDIEKIETYHGSIVTFSYAQPTYDPTGNFYTREVGFKTTMSMACMQGASANCFHYPYVIYALDSNTYGGMSFNIATTLPGWYLSADLHGPLTNISFSDGTNVELTYKVNSRCDMDATSMSISRAMDEIRIKRGSDIKYRYKFYHSFFDSDANAPRGNHGEAPYDDCTGPGTYPFWHMRMNYRLKLDKIRLIGDTTTDAISYEFKYDMNKVLPSKWTIGDHWGYFNGLDSFMTNNIGRLPNDDGMGDSTVLGLNRECDTNYVTTGMLKQIIFNNSATVNYDYEANRGKLYDPYYQTISSTTKIGGGLRIGKITVYDGVDHRNDMVRSFQYLNDDGSSSGMIFCKPIYSYPFYCKLHGQSRFWQSYSLANAFGFTKDGSPCGYSKVRVIYGANGEGGSELYTYTNVVDTDGTKNSILGNGQYSPFPNAQCLKDWRIGLLLSKKVYAKDALSPAKEELYSYDIQDSLLYNNNFFCAKYLLKYGYPNGITTSNYTDSVDFDFCYYWPHITSALVSQKIENDYSSSGILSVTKQYTYDSHRNVSKEIWFGSDGIRHETRYYRAYDYAPSYSTAIQNLLKANRASAFVRRDELIQQTPTSPFYYTKSVVFNFDNINIDTPNQKYIVEPVSLIESKISKPELESTLRPFDSTNLVPAMAQYGSLWYQVNHQFIYTPSGIAEENIVDNHKQSCLFVGGRLVATVKDADAADIAYSSFEGDPVEGYWDIGASNVITTDGFSGKSCFTGSALLRRTLNASYTYTLSVWSKGSSPSLNFLDGTYQNSMTAVRTLNGWTLYKTNITGKTQCAITGNLMDELRLYPQGKFMKTKVNDPLSGVLTECDENDDPIYYEYDLLGRLSLVRDKNKNIVKKMTYSTALPE